MIVIDCQNLDLLDTTNIAELRGYYSNLGSDYLAGGVVYNGQTGVAQMLCFPPGKSDQQNALYRSKNSKLLLSSNGESLYDFRESDQILMLTPSPSIAPTHKLLDSVRSVLPTASSLTIYDKTESIYSKNSKRLQLLTMSNPGSRSHRDIAMTWIPDSLLVAQEQMLAVKFGALFAVDINEIPSRDKPDAITFDHRQSVFHLPIGKPTVIRHTAKNASLYTLSLSFLCPSVGSLPPDTYRTSTKSRTGESEIAISKSPGLLKVLRDVMHSSGYLELDAVAQQEYLDQFANLYSLLGKGRIEGFPIFVQATVIAEGDKGEGRAALAHCYVVDVPLAFLFEL